MLQVIERSPICNRRNHCAQLQRRHGDAFAVRTHLADAAHSRGNHGIRVIASLFASDAVTCQFAEAILVRVIGNFFKAQLASQSLEIHVIGVCQSRSQVHAAATPQGDRSILGNQSLTQRRESDGKLDSRAGLRSARKCQLLVHHRQHPSAGRLDRNHRAIHVAQRVNRRLAHDWIFTCRDVTLSDRVSKRTHVETFVVPVPPSPHRSVPDRCAAAARQTTQTPSRPLALTDFL